MVDKFRQIADKINSERGALNLFAILKMDEFTDKWTLILSAPWIDNTTFEYIRSILVDSFTAEELAAIARLGVFPKSTHIVQELLKYSEGASITSPQQINGNFVHEAHIIKANLSL